MTSLIYCTVINVLMVCDLTIRTALPQKSQVSLSIPNTRRR